MWQTSYSAASYLANGFIGIAASKEIRYQALYSLQICENTRSLQQSALGDCFMPSMPETAAQLQRFCKTQIKCTANQPKRSCITKLCCTASTSNKSHWLPGLCKLGLKQTQQQLQKLLTILQSMEVIVSMRTSAKRQDNWARGCAYLLYGVIQVEGLSKSFGISTEAWSRLQLHKKSPTASILIGVLHGAECLFDF